MSKPILSDLFTYEGRRNRQSYILFHVLFLLVTALVVTSGSLAALASGAVGAIVFSVFVCVYVILATIVGFAVTAQRIRDFGYSGCWCFILLIPYIGFAASVALYFIPSDPGANRYGPSCIE